MEADALFIALCGRVESNYQQSRLHQSYTKTVSKWVK